MTRYVTSGKGRIAAAAFGLVIGTIQGAQADDPAATAKALELLLSISNDPIPDASTCFGDYGQPGKARLRDLLATELAYLYAGSNVITGTCKGDVCSVSITHAAGEDVSSAEISFSVKRGKASAASLKCVITPWL